MARELDDAVAAGAVADGDDAVGGDVGVSVGAVEAPLEAAADAARATSGGETAPVVFILNLDVDALRRRLAERGVALGAASRHGWTLLHGGGRSAAWVGRGNYVVVDLSASDAVLRRTAASAYGVAALPRAPVGDGKHAGLLLARIAGAVLSAAEHVLAQDVYGPAAVRVVGAAPTTVDVLTLSEVALADVSTEWTAAEASLRRCVPRGSPPLVVRHASARLQDWPALSSALRAVRVCHAPIACH